MKEYKNLVVLSGIEIWFDNVARQLEMRFAFLIVEIWIFPLIPQRVDELWVQRVARLSDADFVVLEIEVWFVEAGDYQSSDQV